MFKASIGTQYRDGTLDDSPLYALLEHSHEQLSVAAAIPSESLSFTRRPVGERNLNQAKRAEAVGVRNVRNVRKAVKWNSPLYGIKGQGWFLEIHPL